MKIAVNVRSQEQWDKVTEILGYKWRKNWWNEDKEDTCISLENNERDNINTYMDYDYKIISFKEFMKEYAPSPRDKEYKLIITPTNKTIIIDKETGKKGMARLHPDDEYDFLEGVKVAMNKLNGVELNGVDPKKEEVKKSILSEPEFKKGIVNQPSYCLWNNPLCIDEINKTYEANVVIVRNDIGDSILVNVIGKAKSSRGDVYIIEYKNKRYVAYCEDVKKYEPKLYDSFGEELKEGDRLVLICLEYNKNYTNDTSYVKSDGEKLYSNGIKAYHNSKYNNGKPKNGWQVIKIK